MPHSVPVSKLMTPPSQWPQIRGEADVCTAIKLLRIITEDQKLEHGHYPLIMDDNFNLMGFVHLTDLLKSVKPLWEKEGPGTLDQCAAYPKIKELVVSFAGSVGPDDGILKALDIMMEHKVSMAPVMKDGKLIGMIRLSDIFNEVAALLFDEEDSEEKGRLLRDFHM
jgi:CBS domain containing-hemolysin-like protein